jgi:hypothetical protein
MPWEHDGLIVFIQGLPGATRAGTQDVAEVIRAVASQLAPVDTEALDSTIGVIETGELEFEVHAGGASLIHYVDYAAYEEFGTGPDRPQGGYNYPHYYMTRAAEFGDAYIPEAISIQYEKLAMESS